MMPHAEPTGPLLSFQVRIRSRDGLAALAGRVGAALGLTFSPFFDRMYEDGEAVAAAALGLHIVLSHDPAIPEGELRTYVLIGSLRDDLEVHWPVTAHRQSISEYVLGLLQVTDSADWYIAGKAEKRAEAGLE